MNLLMNLKISETCLHSSDAAIDRAAGKGNKKIPASSGDRENHPQEKS